MRIVPEQLQQILTQHRRALLRRRNVVGCGVGCKEVRGEATGEPALVVFVTRKQPMAALALMDAVPEQIDGVRTDVIEVGQLRMLSERTRRVRPASPGVSIGHYRVTAGTFGAVAYDEVTARPFILSNNHVLANVTNGRDGRARLGDPVYQPGAYDAGGSDDTIGHLRRFVPILTLPLPAADAQQLGPLNRVDAALAEPVAPDVIEPNVLGIGPVRGTASVEVGQRVQKSGRTTGVTQGTVRAHSATLNVAMGDAGIAVFEDQIVTSPMAEPGDSGSAGLTEDGRIFGLLFAGSAQATVFNRIQNAAELLRVRFVP